MKVKQTLSNYVMVELDHENDTIKMKSGVEIAVDTSYEPEKHVVRTGRVMALPSSINNKDTSLPWETELELKVGDRVVMYFLAVQNCLSKEYHRYIKEDGITAIFIKYHNIYAVIRKGKPIPINGYVLVEPIEDPAWMRIQKRAAMIDLKIPDLRKLSKTNVSYGRVAHVGNPNKSYMDDNKSDMFVDVKPGDEIIMKKIYDIPVEYEYHAKLDGSRKLFRLQRHAILAVL